jgi:hypothetical protein
MGLQPQRAGRDGRIDTGLNPPSGFIAATMDLTVVTPASRPRPPGFRPSRCWINCSRRSTAPSRRRSKAIGTNALPRSARLSRRRNDRRMPRLELRHPATHKPPTTRRTRTKPPRSAALVDRGKLRVLHRPRRRQAGARARRRARVAQASAKRVPGQGHVGPCRQDTRRGRAKWQSGRSRGGCATRRANLA